MAESNKKPTLFVLDSTQAEGESIEEQDLDLGLEKRSSDQPDRRQMDKADEAEDAPASSSEETEPGDQAPPPSVNKDKRRKATRVALIASGCVVMLAVGVVGVSSYTSNTPSTLIPQFGDQWFGKTASTERVSGEPDQAGGQGTFQSERAVSSAESFSVEAMSEAIHDLQVDRLIVGQPRLSAQALEQAITQTGNALGASDAQLADYRQMKSVINQRVDQMLGSVSGTQIGEQGFASIVFGIINTGIELGRLVPSSEVSALSQEVALELGVEPAVAQQVATNANGVIANIEKSINQIRSADEKDKALSEALSYVEAAMPSGLAIEQKGGYVQFFAQSANATSLEREQAAARVQAIHSARAAGLSGTEQVLRADIAAAGVEADRRGISDYAKALYVAQGTDRWQAAVPIATAEFSLSEPVAAGVLVHMAIREQGSVDLTPGSAEETAEQVGYLAASVAGAARNAGASIEEQITLAHEAIAIEAGRLELTPATLAPELARIEAMVSAQNTELTELEIMALGERAAAISRERGNQLTDSELQVIGEQAIQAVIRSAGFGQSTEREMISRTLAHSAPIHASDEASGPYADVVATARQEATEQGLNSVDREAYIAKAFTTARMRDAGHAGLTVEVASIRAQARARAQVMGLSDSRQRDIAHRAAQDYMSDQGVSARQQSIILGDIELALSQTAETQESTVAVAATQAGNPSIQALTGRLEKLEQRMASLSVQLTETVELVQRTAEAQSEELATMRGVVDEIKSSIGGQVEGVKESVSEVEAETGRLRANFGWLSNRMCEAEAATGTFSNPKACQAIYAEAKRQQMAGPQAPVRPTLQTAHASNEFVTNAQTPTPITRQTVSAPISNERYQPQRAHGALPSTRSDSAPQSQERVFANLPATRSVQNRVETHVSNTACDNSVDSYRYVTISENNALIANQWGATRRIVHDSYIPDLGAVIQIQARHQPRFIMFENGIVCR